MLQDFGNLLVLKIMNVPFMVRICVAVILNVKPIPVACESGHAGSARVSLYFRSKDVDQHYVDCDAFRPSAAVDSLSVSLVDAAAQRFPIVMNFNFNVGDPNYAQSNVKGAQAQDTPYNRFREENKSAYARDSVRNVEEYFKFVAKVGRKYEASLPDLRVAHCGKIQCHEGFTITGDAGFRALIKAAYEDAKLEDTESGVHVGLPKAFKFILSKRTIESFEALGRTVYSTSHHLSARDGKILLLQNRMHVADQDTAYQLASCEASDVIAIPKLDIGETRKAFSKFNKAVSGATFVSLDWDILSSKQLRRSPGANITEAAYRTSDLFGDPAAAAE